MTGENGAFLAIVESLALMQSGVTSATIERIETLTRCRRHRWSLNLTLLRCGQIFLCYGKHGRRSTTSMRRHRSMRVLCSD